MTDALHAPAPADGGTQQDLLAVLGGLQDRVTGLTATLEAHQRLFERLRMAGLLSSDHDGARP